MRLSAIGVPNGFLRPLALGKAGADRSRRPSQSRKPRAAPVPLFPRLLPE